MPIVVISDGERMTLPELMKNRAPIKRGQEISRQVRKLYHEGVPAEDIARDLRVNARSVQRYVKNAEAEQRRRTITAEELVSMGRVMTVSRAAKALNCERSVLYRLLKRQGVPRSAFKRE